MRRSQWWLWGVVCAQLLCCGCRSVNPAPDYRRTADLIAERSGVPDVYDPAEEAMVEARIAEILADGLTIDEAVRIALINNREFQARFFEIGASRADVVQSGLLTNPSLSLSLQFPEGGGRSKLNAGFAQQLVDLWQIPVRKKIAEQQLQRTVMSVAQRAIELIAEVKAECYRVLALRRAAEITGQHVALLEQSVQLVVHRFEAGDISAFEVNLARADVVDGRLALVGLQRDLQLAEAELQRKLGLSRAGGDITLRDELPVFDLTVEAAEQVVATAFQQRFDAQVARSEVLIAEEELRREYWEVFPDLSLGLEYERSDRRALPGRNVLADTARASVAAGALTVPTIESRGQRDLARSQIIDSVLGPTLQMTLPIWDQNQAQIAKAEMRVLQSRKKYDALLDAIALDVQQSCATAGSAAKLVDLYEAEALPQARENVEGARTVFQGGEQSVLVLIKAQESLIRRQRDYVAALRDLAVAIARLESAVGGRLSQAEAAPAEPAGPVRTPEKG